MGDELLSVREGARRLGVTPTTLYDWLGRSDRGLLVIRGKPHTVGYFQGGPAGQGRIQIEAREIERLQDAMRVIPCASAPSRVNRLTKAFPGITVRLGRPPR